MKILIVTPVGTKPIRSGAAQGVQGYCTALQLLGHDVHLVYHPMMMGDITEMKEEWGDRLHIIPYQHPAVSGSLFIKLSYRLRQWAKTWFYGRQDPRRYNYRLDEWYDENLDDAVVALQQHHRFDAIFVNYVMLSRLFLALQDETLVKILITHDRFSDRNFRVAGTNTAAMWFSCSLVNEGIALQRADKVTAVQESERGELQKITTKPVITITAWARINPLPLASDALNMLVFIGSDIPINLDGIVWFIEEVLPLLRNKNPKLQLKIAGRVCRLIEREYPGVIKLGEVNRVDDAYAGAAIAINPVKVGTGLCIKSMEPLSYGRPLVCSPAGARGLETAKEQGLFVAEDAEDYVIAITRLMESLVYYNKNSLKALKFADNWNKVVLERLADIIK